jgi:hypothetical protein
MASHNDIPGQLQNALSTGVGITDALLEIFDNSISAGSSEIHMKLIGNTLYFSDNGHGMNPDKLEDSAWLNRRTTSSSERHGRFGFGGKQAEITLTNLEGPVTKFSSSDGNTISQITTNYPRILQTGVYAPQVGGLQCDSRHIWDENARDPNGPGMLTRICIPEAVRRELSELCDNITVTGLRFTLATTYRETLTNGVKITIQHGDDIYQVYPFDRLCSSTRDMSLPPNIHYQYKLYEIYILTKEGEPASYYMKPSDGVCKRFDRTKQKTNWIDDDAPESFDLDIIGSLTYEIAYSSDWNFFQQDNLKKNGITPLNDGKKGVEKEQRIKTDGKELVRNGKIIKHSEWKWKNVGNTEKHIHKKIRERISFKASEDMDNVWKVQVNKSSVNESQIDPNLLKSLEQLKTSFMNDCHRKVLESENSVNDSSVCQVESSATSPLMSSISSSPTPPPSEQTIPSKINTKPTPKPKLTIAVKTPIRLSESHSDSNSDDGKAGGGTICAGGGYAHFTEISLFAPDSECDIGSSKRQWVFRKTGETILEEWNRSGKHTETFNETLDKMHIEFSGKIAADTLKPYLNLIRMDDKYDLLLKMIREKYVSPETPMKWGIELQRIYNKTFEADIAAGTSSPM